MSVPAAWKHIQNLEALCNQPLLKKTGRTFALTSLGITLAKQCEELLHASNETKSLIYKIQRSKEIIQIAVPITYQHHIFHCAGEFIKKHPSVHIEFTVMSRIEEVQLCISKKKYQLIFVGDPVLNIQNYECHTLRKYQLTAICSSKFYKDNCLGEGYEDKLKYLPIYTINSDHAQRKELEFLYEKNAISNYLTYFNSYLSIAEAIMTSLGIGIIPSTIGDLLIKSRKFVKLDLEELHSTSTFSLLEQQYTKPTSLELELRKDFKEYYAKLDEKKTSRLLKILSG